MPRWHLRLVYRRDVNNDRQAKERKVDIGDLVLVQEPGKKFKEFSQLFSGPYVVMEALPDTHA